MISISINTRWAQMVLLFVLSFAFDVVAMDRTRHYWSPVEDAKLVRQVGTSDEPDWKDIARSFGLTAKQCRARWQNYANPDLIHGEFTDDELDELRRLYVTYPSQWTEIARKMNRSPNDVRRAWLGRDDKPKAKKRNAAADISGATIEEPRAKRRCVDKGPQALHTHDEVMAEEGAPASKKFDAIMVEMLFADDQIYQAQICTDHD